MFEQREYLLGSQRNVNAVNENINIKLSLTRNNKFIEEDNVVKILNINELYNTERQSSDVYRVQAKIDYLSPLNFLETGYSAIINFFTQNRLDTNPVQTIFNSFDVYLAYVDDQYITDPSVGLTTGKTVLDYTNKNYLRQFRIATNKASYQIYNCGYSINLFDEQQYLLNFKIDVDLANKVDFFGKPLTELFIYFHYKPGSGELLQRKNLYNNTFNTIVQTEYFVNDLIPGDLVMYNKSNFLETEVLDATFKIKTRGVPNPIELLYNPFYKIKIRDFSPESEEASSGSTIDIPYYAVLQQDNNFLWQEFMDKGIVDVDGSGVDYPFINNATYLYTDVVLNIKPNLADTFTNQIFGQLAATLYNLNNYKGNSNLAGKC